MPPKPWALACSAMLVRPSLQRGSMPASAASRPLYASHVRANRSRACVDPLGDGLEVLAAADDALRLEPLPDDVAVLLRLAPDLLEDRIDVEELEGRLAAALERGVEALVDGAIEAGALAANGEHVDAHDEQARLPSQASWSPSRGPCSPGHPGAR